VQRLEKNLIQVARQLGEFGSGRPNQASLRRAVSTAYYAMFHCLAHSAADYLVGASPSKRSPEAWEQVYRALEHNAVKKACENRKFKKFPLEIQDFGENFVTLQNNRHAADYRPRIPFGPDITFHRSAVLRSTDVAEKSIELFHSAPKKDRVAFVIFVILKLRDDAKQVPPLRRGQTN